MGKIIAPKREWVCSNCQQKYIKWAGTCYRGCKATATLEEKTLAPLKPTTFETAQAKKLRRRAKDSERNIAKRMVAVDGPDPAYKNIASSTGRIGHITGMRIDAISRTYVTENKNRKMPTWLIQAWILLNQRAIDFDKNALLHVDPPNMPKEFTLNGQKFKLDTLAIITQTRHEELINNEKLLAELLKANRDSGT